MRFLNSTHRGNKKIKQRSANYFYITKQHSEEVKGNTQRHLLTRNCKPGWERISKQEVCFLKGKTSNRKEEEEEERAVESLCGKDTHLESTEGYLLLYRQMTAATRVYYY